MFNSTDNTVQNSAISYTGRLEPGYGEGLYVGTATSKLNGSVDHTWRVRVLANHFGPHITAEHMDIKEDTRAGLVYNNTFNAVGQTGVHASNVVLNVKGAGYVLKDNIIKQGFQHGLRVLFKHYFVFCL
jgi:hypothetical protein